MKGKSKLNQKKSTKMIMILNIPLNPQRMATNQETEKSWLANVRLVDDYRECQYLLKNIKIAIWW